MSTRTDNVQIRVEMDASSGINELGKLENEMLELQRSMKGLKRDSDEWKQSAEKLDAAKAQTDQLREKLGLTGLTMRQLTKYQSELKQQLANTTNGTEKWTELNSKLTEVTKTVNSQKGVLTEFQKSWGNVKSEIISMGAQAAVVGVLLGIGAAITTVITKSGELSDSLSNVQKTTGMSEEEVKKLNGQLSKVDTRTARDELRSIAAVAGQLAIPNEQILSFVKATDKLNVALGDEIQGGAEEVTRVMGGLRNILTDIKSDDVGADMLHIGNALNVLAAEGSATAPVVADIANRIGGVGMVMGLTSGQTLGLSATMQELNITAERGGTAVVKILQHMAAAPEKFATVTKLSGAEFRKMVDNDIYGALKLVMEGAAGSGAGATQLASTLDALGVDGAGASEVIAKMGLNVKMLDEKTTSATKSLGDTKSIIGEFNTLNDNFAGKLERIGKWWNGLFTANAMKPMLEGMVTWLDGLTSVRDEVQQMSSAWEKNQADMSTLTDTVEPLIARYKELAVATDDTGRTLARSGDEQAELDKVIQDIAKHIPEAVTAWNEYGEAMGIVTLAAERALVQQKNMLKVKNADQIQQMRDTIKVEEQLLKEAVDQKNSIQKNAIHKDSGEVVYWAGNLETMKILDAKIEETKEKLDGLRGLLAQATGEKTPEQLAKEAAAKHAKDLADMNASLALLKQIEDKIKALKEQQDGIKGHIGDFPKEMVNLQKEIDALEEYRQKLLGKWKDKDAAKRKKDAEKEAADRKKEHDQILADFYKLQEAVHKAQEKVNLDRLSADQRELQEIEQKYDELTDRAVDFANNEKLTEKERAAALLEIKKINDAKEIELFDKKAEQLKKREAILLRNRIAEVEAEAALKVLLAQREFDETAPEKGGNSKDHQDARVKLEEAQVAAVIKLRDLELFELNKIREKDVLAAADVAERKRLIEEKASGEIKKIRQKTAEEEFKENWQKVTKYIGLAQEVGNAFIGIVQNNQTKKAKKDEQDYKRALKQLDSNLKNKLISEDNYQTSKQELDDQYDQKSRQRQREAAETQKEANIFNAVMNGAVAVTKALADLGPIAGPPMAMFVGTLALAQVAMLASTEIPEYREGGFTTEEALALPHENLSRSSGGMMHKGPFLATVNEAGPEYFVPNRLLSDPRVQPHVKAIEAIRTTNTASNSPGFVAGGPTSATATSAPAFTAPTSTATAGQPAMSEATGQLIAGQLGTLIGLWQEGKVVTGEWVPEALAKTTDLLKQTRKGASY